jgi:hypothetical protein
MGKVREVKIKVLRKKEEAHIILLVYLFRSPLRYLFGYVMENPQSGSILP